MTVIQRFFKSEEEAHAFVAGLSLVPSSPSGGTLTTCRVSPNPLADWPFRVDATFSYATPVPAEIDFCTSLNIPRSFPDQPDLRPFMVDMPDVANLGTEDCGWTSVGQFNSIDEALAFVRDNLGECDNMGRVKLITYCPDNTED